MNRKGQVLVMFVILIPILFIIMTLVIDIGNLILVNNEINDISYIALDNCLKNIEKENAIEKSKQLIKLNKKEIDIKTFKIENDIVYLEVEYQLEGIISRIIDISYFNINNKYEAYIKDGNKIIEKKE